MDEDYLRHPPHPSTGNPPPCSHQHQLKQEHAQHQHQRLKTNGRCGRASISSLRLIGDAGEHHHQATTDERCKRVSNQRRPSP